VDLPVTVPGETSVGVKGACVPGGSRRSQEDGEARQPVDPRVPSVRHESGASTVPGNDGLEDRRRAKSRERPETARVACSVVPMTGSAAGTK
jgi:hypothetical protein